MTWKKILCAVDFSEPSRIAMLEAAALARDADAALVVAHVYQPPRGSMVATDMLAPAPAEVEATVAEDAERRLRPWVDEAGKVADRAVEPRVVPGAAAERIVALARELGADLVVLATHGRTGLARVLLGSVAERVVREAPCSVLVVRRPLA
jgi:universal stress protein A